MAQSIHDAERIGAAVGAELLYSGAEKIVFTLMESPEMAAHIAAGVLLRCSSPSADWRTKKPSQTERPSLKKIVVATHDPEAAQKIFSALFPLIESILLARDWTTTPANLMSTKDLCRQAEALRPLGVEVEILGRKGLTEQGLNLLLAVGQGSRSSPARLVCVRWKGEGAPKRPVALIGKGIVFDTGGISIKPALHMEEMKGDMAGAAAVLAAIRTMALRRSPVHVLGVLALAENTVSEQALRPGDVVRATNGKTVEIIDTDAEGRLVLADALAWTCQHHRPFAAATIATLTGSVVTTLGHQYAGLMTKHDHLATAPAFGQ